MLLQALEGSDEVFGCSSAAVGAKSARERSVMSRSAAAAAPTLLVTRAGIVRDELAGSSRC